VCVFVFVEVVIMAVSIFTEGARQLFFVCLCVCRGGLSGIINFYMGCRKANACVSVCLRKC
jgi:hypothetical protein